MLRIERKPSKTSIKAFLEKVRGIIKSGKTLNQEILIRRLNPVIRGWVNNQRFVVSSNVFSRVDYEIYKCLWQWAKRRHKNKGRKWIAAKYWRRIGNRQWTFSVPLRAKDKEGGPAYLKLEYATDTKILRFKKIVTAANPFDELS